MINGLLRQLARHVNIIFKMLTCLTFALLFLRSLASCLHSFAFFLNLLSAPLNKPVNIAKCILQSLFHWLPEFAHVKQRMYLVLMSSNNLSADFRHRTSSLSSL